MPRSLAVAAVFLGIFGVIALIAWLIIPTLVAQARILASRAPELASVVRERLNLLLPGDLIESLWSQTGRVAGEVLEFPVGIGAAIATAARVLFLASYWLLGKAARERFIASLFPPDRARRVLDVQHKMGCAAGGYVRGTIINATITAVATYVGLLLIGLDFALPLAGLMFLGEFVPYLGPIVAAIPGLAVAQADSTTTALWALVVYVVVQQVENQILVPNIMHRQSAAPQSLLLIAVFAGGLVLGILGLLIAVPVAAALTVFVEEVAAPAFRRRMEEAAGPPTEEGV
jgi:predicted PurR-regulated permease PerM